MSRILQRLVAIPYVCAIACAISGSLEYKNAVVPQTESRIVPLRDTCTYSSWMSTTTMSVPVCHQNPVFKRLIKLREAGWRCMVAAERNLVALLLGTFWLCECYVWNVFILKFLGILCEWNWTRSDRYRVMKQKQSDASLQQAAVPDVLPWRLFSDCHICNDVTVRKTCDSNNVEFEQFLLLLANDI
jgi:hypothetical protein